MKTRTSKVMREDIFDLQFTEVSVFDRELIIVDDEEYFEASEGFGILEH